MAKSSCELWEDFLRRYYWEKILELAKDYPEKKSLYVQFSDIELFDMDVAHELLEKPDLVLKHANEALKCMDLPADVEFKDTNVRIFKLPERIQIRELRSIHINKFISIAGIVRKATEVRPRIVNAAFKCQRCGNITYIPQTEGKFIEPYMCENEVCGRKGPFKLVHEESEFIDAQKLRVQESPDELKGGEQPQSLDVDVDSDIAGVVTPGDRVVITGILRSYQRSTQHGKSTFFDLVLDGISIEIEDKEFEDIELSKEDVKKILALGKSPDIYDIVVRSIAPSIYGYEEVKEALALQLFSGIPKMLPDGTRIRGDFHILLVGDPGVAKCVDFDTEILLGDGSVVKIGELVNSSINGENSRKIEDGWYAETYISVASLNSNKLKSRVATANIVWKRTSPDFMYEIRTKSGRKLKCTKTHPFFTIKDGSFTTVKAIELKNRDLIATPAKMPIFGKSQPLPKNFEKSNAKDTPRLVLPEKTTPQFWRFVGFFIAKGYAQKHENEDATIFFTNKSIEIINEFFEYVKKLGLDPNITHKDKSAKVFVSSTELYNFFELLNIDGKSRERRVPDLLFKCSREEIRAFLSAFFDASSSVHRRKITVISTSEQLLRHIQHLLLRFGILSQLHEKSKAGIDKNTRFRLTITGENCLKFIHEIGFTPGNKRVEWELRNSNLDVIPGVSDILKETRKMLGLSQYECGIKRTTYQHLERGDTKPSRKTLRRIVKAFKEKLRQNGNVRFNVEFLELLAESDIFWDEIVEIRTYRPSQSYVYDLQVPEHHNFIANNIFVHNSQLLRYAVKLAPRGIYTSGKSSTSAGLCVAPESLVFTENNVFEIGRLVDSMKLTEFKEGIFSGVSKQLKVQTINSTKISLSQTSTLWKIKSPEKLVKIKAQTGKEIIITAETKILVLENGEIKWKKARELKESDFVATVRRLNYKGKKLLTIELIKNLDITVYGVKSLVKELIEMIKTKKGLTKRKLAEKLSINDYANINLKTLVKLSEEAEYSLEKIAENIKGFSQYHGHKIKLPKYLDERFLYFAGLIAGDGDITKSQSMIRFSNRNKVLRRKFKQLIKELFGINVKDNGSRTPVIFYSKIIAYILNNLEIPESDMSEVLLSLPDQELLAYIKGLFDCDGGVVIRRNSGFVKIDTTNEQFSKKIQFALLRFGIISYLRKRECKVEVIKIKGKTRKIIKKHDRYELIIYGENIEKFNRIGFEHPEKSEKLQKLIQIREKRKNNRVNEIIPHVCDKIKEIRMFYGLSIEEVESNLSENRKRISRKILQKVVKNLAKADINNIKIEIPDELRIKIGKTLKPEELNLNRTKFYEYFKRKGRKTKIPLKILIKIQKLRIEGDIQNRISKILDNLANQEKSIKEKLEYLKRLAYSDILWERIKEIHEINTPYEYVYDLTIDNSHSFIANGIVVHNTATAVKDEFGEGRWTLDAGALVLADMGLACVDELDKMSSEDRSSLHEAMEQQTISIAKAGIMATLKSRCALLGAANPKFGRFDRYEPIAKQINMPPALLSRFDLIFILTDIPSVSRDTAIAEHILRAHYAGELSVRKQNITNSGIAQEEISKAMQVIQPVIDTELLRKYIAYTKRHIFPVLQEDAKKELIDFYIGLRKQGEDPNSPVPVTARQLEALIRLAEASARVRLSNVITKEDTDRVIRIVMASLNQVMRDETGRLDADIINVGIGKSQRDRIKILREIIQELQSEHKGGAPLDKIISKAEDVGIKNVEDMIQQLKGSGEIYEVSNERFKVV